jgi:hypothetical protein
MEIERYGKRRGKNGRAKQIRGIENIRREWKKDRVKEGDRNREGEGVREGPLLSISTISVLLLNPVPSSSNADNPSPQHTSHNFSQLLKKKIAQFHINFSFYFQIGFVQHFASHFLLHPACFGKFLIHFSSDFCCFTLMQN